MEGGFEGDKQYTYFIVETGEIMDYSNGGSRIFRRVRLAAHDHGCRRGLPH